MASIKQTKAIQNLVENGSSVRRAMLDAGYSPKTVVDPGKLTRSKAFKQSPLGKMLSKKDITLDNSLQPIADGLKATRYDMKNREDTDAPDHTTRMAASDRALKLLQLAVGHGTEQPKKTDNLSPALSAAIANGDVAEIQRMIFNKQENTVETITDSPSIDS